jgi:hypothetical protein
MLLVRVAIAKIVKVNAFKRQLFDADAEVPLGTRVVE